MLVKKKRFRYRYILILIILFVIGIFYGRSKVPLKAINIQGTNRSGEILSRLSIPGGTKLFSLNEKKIKERLLQISWVKDVKIYRFFTGNLMLSVKERKPIAYFLSSKPMGVEDDGSIFPLDSIPDSIPELVGGEFSADALGWAIAFTKSLTNKAFCQKIYPGPDGPITRYKHYKIIWGKGNYKKKERYLEEIIKMKIRKGILDMRFNGQVVYRAR